MNLYLDGEPAQPGKILASFLLYPSLTWTSPSVLWTLRHEILFYAVFGLFILNRRAGAVALTIWFLACVLQAFAILVGSPVRGVLSLVLSPLNLDFAIGAASAALVDFRSNQRAFSRTLPIGVGAVILTSVSYAAIDGPARTVMDYVQQHQVGWDLAFGCSFGLLVLGLARSDRHLRTPQFMVKLGAASYALYLIHTPVMGLAARVLTIEFIASPLGVAFSYVLLGTLSLTAATAAHVLFEKPVATALRKGLQTQAAQVGGSATSRAD